MAGTNKISRIKELIATLEKANRAYYMYDAPIMEDREYDELMDELAVLEKETGVVFANSPSRKVGGGNKKGLKRVEHSKPMLSAQKTKSEEELFRFSNNMSVVMSWKMDGLTIVLRYKDGEFYQAITRGEEGLVGEDITHNVCHIKNLPKKVRCKEAFEVRGEGVISWDNYKKVCENTDQSHPRNVAAGAVRAYVPEKSLLSKIEFFAFELISSDKSIKTKEQQLTFLKDNGFTVVEHRLCDKSTGLIGFVNDLRSFDPENYKYPADGIMTEFNDLKYGRSLGATAHHENRMMALKWEDPLYETTFKRVTLSTTRTGKVTIAAEFEPVIIDGNYVSRADLHSFEHFRKLKLGVGDTIRVYKANQIIPQVADNLTQSGTYKLETICPCCGSALVSKNNTKGGMDLYCTNDSCIAQNTQKLVKFCASDAMNIYGVSEAIIEKLMSNELIKNFRDIYRLKNHKDKITAIPGIGNALCNNIISAIDDSRYCRLGQFLYAIDIPYMSVATARAIDEYYYGSFAEFEKAINDHFNFASIEGVTEGLNRSIYSWYTDPQKEKMWRPLLEELTFVSDVKRVGKEGNPFFKANVVVTGTVNGMNHDDMKGLLEVLGANVAEAVDASTHYLIVGSSPEYSFISKAMLNKITIVNETKFANMLGNSEA